MDDGSQTIDFSLKALKALHEFGVERVIFTPHHTYPRFMKTTEEVQNVFDELKQTAEQKQLPIKCEGFSYEYRVDDSFEELVNTGKWGEPQCQVRPLSGRTHLTLRLAVSGASSQRKVSLDRKQLALSCSQS